MSSPRTKISRNHGLIIAASAKRTLDPTSGWNMADLFGPGHFPTKPNQAPQRPQEPGVIDARVQMGSLRSGAHPRRWRGLLTSSVRLSTTGTQQAIKTPKPGQVHFKHTAEHTLFARVNTGKLDHGASNFPRSPCKRLVRTLAALGATAWYGKLTSAHLGKTHTGAPGLGFFDEFFLCVHTCASQLHGHNPDLFVVRGARACAIKV